MKITIIKECSEFLKQSNGNALIRFLPKEGSDQRKVKVRKRKPDSGFDNLFNAVFSEHPDLRQRSVFCNGALGVFNQLDNPELDPFYIFPVDGFKFMYSPQVFNSAEDYHTTLQTFAQTMDDETAFKTFSDVLKYDYVSENLEQGIRCGCEIILYGIPNFYAIRASSVNSYSTLFSL